jgi:SAM-dependent methyltransferase
VSFIVAAESYARFMGRFSEPLAVEFAALLDPVPGQRVLDVGSGPGALTAVLVERVGATGVSAADPSPPFVEALRQRFPDVDAQSAPAEELPWPDATFDAAGAQLVVHFMSDPPGGIREMARVTRPGGVVAACVWDFGTGRAPLSVFWRAAHDVDPDVHDESGLAGVNEGDLGRIFRAAGLTDVDERPVGITVPIVSFDDWWQPYTLGVGPAGAYVATLDEAQREALRRRCAELLPEPITVVATAWAARAVV